MAHEEPTPLFSSSTSPPLQFWPWDLRDHAISSSSSTSSISSSWTNYNYYTCNPWPHHHQQTSVIIPDLYSSCHKEDASDSDQLWTRIFLGEDTRSSSKILEPETACDYLNKLDTHTQFTNHINRFDVGDQVHTNSVTKWSIAPPNHFQNPPTINHLSLNTTSDCYGLNQSLISGQSTNYDHHGQYGKVEYEHEPEPEPDNYGVSADSSCQSSKKFSDVISFSNRLLLKPLDFDVQVPKPDFVKTLKVVDCATATQIRRRQSETAKEEKKKTTEMPHKKPKINEQDSPISSSIKANQAPKVKFTVKVTALQQIVSPFGKTDTASVLLEAIQYIKSLQEQIQLLTNSYKKTNYNYKGIWRNFDMMQNGETKNVDLRSKGLCLVPISFTSKIYHEITGSDYLTPTFRGHLYK